MIEDNADLAKAIYVLFTSPSTPPGVRAMVADTLEDAPEEKARKVSAALRSLPAGALASYSEPERAQLSAGQAAAGLLGY